MEILGYRQYYEEAIEALEEIGSILDYNTNARCESGRRDLVSHVRHYKLNDGQYRRLYEQAQKDLEEHKRRRQADNKFIEITDKKIDELNQQIDTQKDTIGRQLAEIKRLQEVNGSHLARISTLAKIGDALSSKMDQLKDENQRLQDVINRLKPASDAAEVISLKIENNCLKSKLNKIEKVLKGEM